MDILKRIAVIFAAVMCLTGCSYSYSINGEVHDNSGFRLPETDDLSPVSDDYSPVADEPTESKYDGQFRVYTLPDGKFSFEMPDDEKIVLVSEEDDFMLFNLEGRDDEFGSIIMLMSGENEDNVANILAASGIVDGNEYKEYRINGRRAAVMTQGTTDPLQTDETLCLYEQILIDYDDSVLVIISNAMEDKSRDDFFNQRIIIKDIISSIKYMNE